MENIALPFKETFLECIGHFPKPFQAKGNETWQEIEELILIELKQFFKIMASAKMKSKQVCLLEFTDIYDTFCRVQALHQFRKAITSILFMKSINVPKGKSIPMNRRSSLHTY